MYRKISPILFGAALTPYFFVLALYLRTTVIPMIWLRPATGRRMLNKLIRFWGVNFMRMGTIITGVNFNVSGFKPEAGKPYFVLSNHQSIIDIAVLFWVFRDTHVKFVMKKELKWFIPNISPATRTARFAFLDRAAGARANEKILTDFADAVKEEGTGCIIFPGGTRSRDGRLRPFKRAGVMMIANQVDYDVLVVSMDGSWRAATPGDFYKNLPGLTINVHIEEPRPMNELRESSKSFLHEARETMRRRLEGFRGEPVEDYVSEPREQPAQAAG